MLRHGCFYLDGGDWVAAGAVCNQMCMYMYLYIYICFYVGCGPAAPTSTTEIGWHHWVAPGAICLHMFREIYMHI